MKITLKTRLKLWWYGKVLGYKIMHFGKGKRYEKYIVCVKEK